MEDFLELVGPEAIRNLLQNWPFAALVVMFSVAVWRQLVLCYDARARDFKAMLEIALKSELPED